MLERKLKLRFARTEFGPVLHEDGEIWNTHVPLPGAPIHRRAQNPTTRLSRLEGTGVWNHYFEPLLISDWHVLYNSKSCQLLPYVRLDPAIISPGLQFFSPHSVRSWVYQFLPTKLKPLHSNQSSTVFNLQDWFEPQRIRAHRIVQRYFRFRPSIQQRSFAILPSSALAFCFLGLHIRWSDKGGLVRRRIEFSEATRLIWNLWPSPVLDRIVSPANITRSSTEEAVFQLEPSHHLTNQGVLTDILSLSRCHFLIHGFSAVSESAIYINIDLHYNRSVNLEDPAHLSSNEFGELVRREIDQLRT